MPREELSSKMPPTCHLSTCLPLTDPLICSLLIRAHAHIHLSVPTPAFPLFSTVLEELWRPQADTILGGFSGESCPSQGMSSRGKLIMSQDQPVLGRDPDRATRKGSSEGRAKQHCLGLECGLLSLWKASGSTLLPSSERSSHALLASPLHLRMNHEVQQRTDWLAHFGGHCTLWSPDPGFLSL